MRDDTAPKDAASRPLWRNRDWTLLWTGDAISGLGTSMAQFALPLVTFMVTQSVGAAALVSTLNLLAGVAVSLFGGAYADRLDRKRVLVTCQIIGFLVSAGLAAALIVGQLNLVLLCGASIIFGLRRAFYHPANSGALRQIVPGKQMGTAASLNEARSSAASLAGPPLGGVLLAASKSVPFIVDAVSYLVGAVTAATIKRDLTPPPRKNGSKLWAEIGEGLTFLVRRAGFFAVLICAALVNLCLGALLFTITIHMAQIGIHPGRIGMVQAIIAGASLAGAILAPRLLSRFRLLAVVVAPLFLVGAGMAVLPMIFDDPIKAGIALGVGSLFLPAANAGLMGWQAAVTPNRLQGRVGAGMGFVAESLAPAGPAVGGLLLASMGAKSALVIAGAMAVAIIPILLSSEIRRTGTQETWVHDSEDTDDQEQVDTEQTDAEQTDTRADAGQRGADEDLTLREAAEDRRPQHH